MSGPGDDPIAAIATAPGRGGIGVVRVSGRNLAPLTLALLGKVPASRHAMRAAFLDARGAPVCLRMQGRVPRRNCLW